MLSKPIAQPKGKTRKQLKARKDRHEAAVLKAVRADCVKRDGWCLFGLFVDLILECKGPSEWAHLPPKTRAQTRGRPPEERHQLAYTAMLCRAHHDRVDGRAYPRLTIETPLPITFQRVTS